MPHPLLAIETSVETGSVALFSGGDVLFEKSFLAGRRPSATLWPPLQEALTQIENLAGVVVGTGPGSYNGARVGIAAAQGIALVHQCPVIPLCSFEGVTPTTPTSLAIGDARRGNFSLQKITQGALVGDFELVGKEDLALALQAACDRGEEVFSFDHAERFPVSSALQKQIVPRQSQALQLARAYFHRDSDEQIELTQKLAEPFYLRAPHITIGKKKSPLARSEADS